MDIMKKLEGLQNVEELEQELATATSVEELQAVLSAHGVELTVAEIEELTVPAGKLANGELSADELEGVAGGAVFINGAAKVLWYIIRHSGIFGPKRLPLW